MKTVEDVRARISRRVNMSAVQVVQAGTKWGVYYKADEVDAYELTTDVAGMSESMTEAELNRLADTASAEISKRKAAVGLSKAFGSTFMKGSNREVRRTL